MNVSITPLDHGIFEKLLDFSVDCSCDAFVVHYPRTQDTFGHQRLPDATWERIRPFWVSGSRGSPRYCFTGFLNSESKPILLALARNELASSQVRVNFGQLSSITLQAKLLLQVVLYDRFHLRAHWEMRNLPVYKLVVGKDGPKLKQSAPDAKDEPPNSSFGSSGRRLRIAR